jgi:cell division protein FtsL
MTRVLDVMAREGLGTLVGQIYERKPISDPHIMIMGVDDFESDSPLQVTQFETENKPLIEQLERIWLVRRGGGNNYESYAAAWLFAAIKTSIDCFEKRGKRGYLFTIGDECPTPILYKEHLSRHMGLNQDHNFEGSRALEMAQATYNVFHVVVEEGDYASRQRDRVYDEWRRLLGQNVIPLTDHTKIAEVIVSAIQVAEGESKEAVAKSWSGDTSVVVADAIRDVVEAERKGSSTLRLY